MDTLLTVILSPSFSRLRSEPVDLYWYKIVLFLTQRHRHLLSHVMKTLSFAVLSQPSSVQREVQLSTLHRNNTRAKAPMSVPETIHLAQVADDGSKGLCCWLNVLMSLTRKSKNRGHHSCLRLADDHSVLRTTSSWKLKLHMVVISTSHCRC